MILTYYTFKISFICKISYMSNSISLSKTCNNLQNEHIFLDFKERVNFIFNFKIKSNLTAVESKKSSSSSFSGMPILNTMHSNKSSTRLQRCSIGNLSSRVLIVDVCISVIGSFRLSDTHSNVSCLSKYELTNCELYSQKIIV